MSTTLSLEVELRPEWRNVARASEAVALLVLGIYGDDDLRDALAMVSGELLENAIKYAQPRTRVKLAIHEETSDIVVAVTNDVLGAEEVRRLEDRIAWLRAHETAAAAYMEALTLASMTPGASGGLGILRIAYEGGCGIDYDASSEPGKITVRASMNRSELDA